MVSSLHCISLRILFCLGDVCTSTTLSTSNTSQTNNSFYVQSFSQHLPKSSLKGGLYAEYHPCNLLIQLICDSDKERLPHFVRNDTITRGYGDFETNAHRLTLSTSNTSQTNNSFYVQSFSQHPPKSSFKGGLYAEYHPCNP